MSRIVFGSFDAEGSWDLGRPSRLSPIQESLRDPSVLAMDELLAPLCDPQDTLCTILETDEALAKYLAEIGLGCVRRACGGPGTPGRICQLLQEPPNLGWIRAAARDHVHVQPYAVSADTAALWTFAGIKQPLPTLESVRRVNSKIWSFELRRQLDLPGEGCIVRDAVQFERAGEKLLARGSFVAKEEYGVSGRGNLHIASHQRLQRVALALAAQERRGCCTRLVLEEYHDKTFDFSFQIWIGESGEVTQLSLQGVRNRDFSYEGSFPLDDERRTLVERAVPRDFVESVASALYREGYFGPVCIDAMSLANGGIVPLIEINARVSMGYINYRLSERLRSCGRRSFLGLLRIGGAEPPPFRHLMRRMREERLLFDPDACRGGVIPLASRTMPSPDDPDGTAGRPTTGKFFFAIPYADPSEVGRELADLRDSMSKDYRLYN